MRPLQSAIRYHDISCGHRVAGHESKCAHLHGHNYRVTFEVVGNLDDVGRVMDFSVIKEKLCMWLEENWDHKFLCWVEDDVMHRIYGDVEQNSCPSPHLDVLAESLVWVPFNPTAENMAGFLLQNICPLLLMGTNVQVIRVTVEETRKCSASVYQLSEL